MESVRPNGHDTEAAERSYEFDEQEATLPAPSTLAIISKSEIEQQVDTARKYPRSIKRFRNEALQMVTLTEKIAQECIYALPRDGKVIEGPSARFAEVAASAWGNCRAGARTISDEGEFVTAQGVFHDLERNIAITYEVKRRIVNKYGKRYSNDMIGVTANAACSIALRNAVLKGIPKAFWSDIYDSARQTVMGDVKTLANRRADAIQAFQAYGISSEQICKKLGVSGVEDISLDQLVQLRGIFTAIKEGEITPETAFAEDQPQAQVATNDRKEALKDSLKTKRAAQTADEKSAADFKKRLAACIDKNAEAALDAMKRMGYKSLDEMPAGEEGRSLTIAEVEEACGIK